MKRLFCSLLVCMVVVCHGQKSLQLGYFGPIGNEPGLSLGFNGQQGIGPGVIELGSSISFWSRNKDNQNFLLQQEFGYQLNKRDHKSKLVLSLGLGYLAQLEMTSFSVNLQGEVVNKERELRNIFLPSTFLEFNSPISTKLKWYVKLGYAYRISSHLNHASFMGGLGIRYLLNTKANNDE